MSRSKGGAFEPTEKGILWFAVEKFSARLFQMLDKKGLGIAWRSEKREWLFMRLRQEVEGLQHAIAEKESFSIGKEALDVAAFAMMIFDVSQNSWKSSLKRKKGQEV